MRILFTGKNFAQGLKDTDESSIALAAVSEGYEVVEFLEERPDLVVCVDFDYKSLKTLRAARRKGVPSCLIANEPEVVIPEHGKTSVRRKFDKVLLVGRPGSPVQLKWPQTWSSVSENEVRMNRAVLINADKWSFVSGQLYWLRAGLVSGSELVDTFGGGWNRPNVIRLLHRAVDYARAFRSLRFPSHKGLRHIFARPRAWMGTVPDKLVAMERYKVAVVIENSVELMTEKIFDAWFAGCIPVYVGPDLESFGLDARFAVKAEPNIAAVEKAIQSAIEIDGQAFREELRGFVRAADLRQQWNANSALKAILRAID